MGLLSSIKKEFSRAGRRIEKEVKRWGEDLENLFNPEDPDYSGLTVNKSSATESIKVAYGEVKLGGTRVFLTSNGSKNKNLNSVLVQCVGPIHSSSEVLVSDKAEGEYGSKLRYTFHAGYPDQAADANFVSELSDWTTDHRLQGVAYQAIRYTYDQDKYSGLPTFTSVIKGALLYDPRDETTSYSNNFALVVLDYFRSSEYGVAVSDDLIDFESFKTSANTAEASYPSNTDSDVMVKRFACNIAVDTSQTPFDNIKQLVAESRAFLTQTAGQWRYVIQNDSTANHTVTYDDIVGDISRSPNGARDKYNKVTVSFTDPDTEWETNEATYPIDDDEYQAYLEEDNWEESHSDMTVQSCTNRYQALDIARQALLESRIGGVLSFSGQPWMIKVRCGDLLEMDVPGLNDGMLWRVSARTVSANAEISFTCAAYDPSIFPWIDLPDQTVITAPTVASGSTLPAPDSLTYFSSEWSDSSVGKLSWPQSDSAFVYDYLIEIYRASDGIQVLSTTLANSNDWADDYEPQLNLPYLASTKYYATVRARNALTRSETTTATFSIDVPAVGRVTGLALVGDFDSSLTVQWTALSSNALKHYQVELYDVVNGKSYTKTSTATESVTLSFELFKSIGLPRSFEVRVSGVNVAGEVGEASAIAVSKPAPIAPTIQTWASVNDAKLTLSAAQNATGVVVWLADEAPVSTIDANQKYKGESLSITLDGLGAQSEYHIAIASYDAFGLGESSAHSFTTLNDAVADSIQQLTERDLSLSNSLEDIQGMVENLDLESVNGLMTDIQQVADEVKGSVTQQIVSIHKLQVADDELGESAFLEAARSAEAARTQTAQSDTIALARSETKAVAGEATAIAQSVEELAVVVGDNQAEFVDYRRTAIGYCVDANGNPTSHETAAACELVPGNVWRGESSIAEALRNVTVTGKNGDGDDVEVSAGNLYQAILNADGTATATAAVLAIYGDQLAGIFANAGEDGSELQFLANSMKFKTENGTKTPFSIEGDDVFLDQATIKSLLVSKLVLEDGSVAFEDGKLKADYIDADNLEVDFAKIQNVSVKSADIEDGAIGSAKIGDVIQSDNYESGISGWKIKKDGSAEFNAVVVSRELVIGSGVYDVGALSGGTTADLTLIHEEIFDTEVVGAAWSGTNFLTIADVGFTATQAKIETKYVNSAQWGVTAELLPITRWNTSPTMHIRLRIYAKRIQTLSPCKIQWRLLRVT